MSEKRDRAKARRAYYLAMKEEAERPLTAEEMLKRRNES